MQKTQKFFPLRSRCLCGELLIALVFNKPIDEASGDTEFIRNLRKRVSRKPGGMGYFSIIDTNVTTCMACGKADHQRP